MLKKHFSIAVAVLAFVILGSCASAPVAAQVTRSSANAPSWLSNLDNGYPDKVYVAAVGTGDNRRSAESAAAGALASRFKVSIKVDTNAQQRYREIVKQNQNYSEEERNIIQNVSTSSNESLLNLRYSEPYSDSRGTVSIVAYIEREPTAQLYRKIVEKDAQTIASLKSRAGTAVSSIVAFALYDSAIQVSLNDDSIVEKLQLIHPATAFALASKVDTAGLLRARDEIASKLSYRLTVDGDVDGKIASIVRKTLTDLKLVANQAGKLGVNAFILIEPTEVNPRFKSVRWTITVALTDETGATIANLFKESRENAISEQEARAFAIKSIEKAVASDFVKEFNKYLNGVALGK